MHMHLYVVWYNIIQHLIRQLNVLQYNTPISTLTYYSEIHQDEISITLVCQGSLTKSVLLI